MRIKFFIIFLTFSMNAWCLENPFIVASDNFQTGDYVSVINALEKDEQEYLNSSFRDMYLQAIGTYVSYVGEYKNAIESFDQIGGQSLGQEIDLNNYQKVSAVKSIEDVSRKHQIIFVNEAHHIPQHRAFTLSILKTLYKNGFRYFAAETFNHFAMDDLNQRKYPLLSTGNYTAEPIFGELVREALSIGFKLVAYEIEVNESECNWVPNDIRCANKREKAQAVNIINKILKTDPRAKVLVHAGYGHIVES